MGARSPVVLFVALTAFTTLVALGASAVRADDRVYADSESVKPLLAGTKIPVAVLHTVLGKPIDLAATIGDGGALLVFYRGGW